MDEIVLSNNGFVSPATDLQTAIGTYQMMADFVKSVLREEVDYGTIDGTSKPTLLKPGAEKLLRFFGMYSRMELQEKIEDWTGKDHDGEPFFFYRYKTLAIRNGEVVAEGVGSCNSWEKKYRYRTAELTCPECGQPLRKSKRNNEYYCWTKTGGCGATFSEKDPRVMGQQRGAIPNPNPADIVNTIDKMAQKRGLVAVALVACNASEYFTQDIEDLDFLDGSFTVVQKSETENEVKKHPEIKPVSYQGHPIMPREKIISPTDEIDTKKYDFHQRPYEPETLLAAIQQKAKEMKPASDPQMRLLGSMFSQYFQDDTKVKEAKRYLFGVTSLKDADRREINAALSWLKLGQDDGGAYFIDQTAKEELAKILDATARANGQDSLPI